MYLPHQPLPQPLKQLRMFRPHEERSKTRALRRLSSKGSFILGALSDIVLCVKCEWALTLQTRLHLFSMVTIRPNPLSNA